MNTDCDEAVAFRIGDSIVLPQLFNATCATIVAIERGADGSSVALCRDAHDLFGRIQATFVRIPLAHAKVWHEAPRRLSIYEALMA